MLREFVRALARWPLLLVGLVICTYGVVELAEAEDRSDARAFVLSLGAVLLGAGLALDVRTPPPGRGPDPDDD